MTSSTSAFHNRRTARFEAAIRDSLQRGIPVYGSAPHTLVERIQAEIEAEKVQKKKSPCP
jgi:hypothetical protein